MSQVKDVVVVGGSLSGLMSAIVCKSLGHRVHVLERSDASTLQSQAAGIRAGPDVHAFIERYVNDDIDYANTLPFVEIIDDTAQVVMRIPSSEPLRLTTWYVLYKMFKAALINGNTTKNAARYEIRKQVQKVEPHDEKLAVSYLDLENKTHNTVYADFVIASDGAHSTVRSMLAPVPSPQYAGYVSWRGRVPEKEVSKETLAALQNRVVMYRHRGGYIVSYYVPAEINEIKTRENDFVWVWYYPLPEDAPGFAEALTDVDGKRHLTTIARGKASPAVWNKIRSEGVPNFAFAELIKKTSEPFISAIRDKPASQAVFYDGKLVLVGDAMALQRPHSGDSTNQAAIQALGLAKMLQGESTIEQWEQQCCEKWSAASAYSKAFGEFGFTGKVSAAVAATISKKVALEHS